MKLPDDKRSGNAVDRFRTILTADKEPEPDPEKRKPAVVNLPGLGSRGGASAADYVGDTADAGGGSGSSHSGILPAFWTIACLVSLAANAYLLLTLSRLTGSQRAIEGTGLNAGMLAGLYNSFSQMDNAHIRTTIPLRSTIPVEATVPLQTATRITLAQEATVDGAHVKISTDLFNIDAPASVTLPVGTALDVALDLQLPVKTNVPLAIDIPVDIAVQDTDLHPAILSAQETIRPLLCEVSPQAALPSGEPICP
jgi:hypothetical protein